MAYELNTNITDAQAENTAGRVSREQFERYMSTFVPQEEALTDTLGATSAEDAAGEAQANAQRSRASLGRMRERYGTSLTDSQRTAEDSATNRSTTLGSLSAVNTGRQLDEDRKFNLQGSLLNIGNGLSSSAMSGLTQSSNNATARQQTYEQAQAQHSAQKSQQTASTVGSIATLAAMAFM